MKYIKDVLIQLFGAKRHEKPQQTTNEIVAEAWFRDRGDETHRLEYDLNEKSIVVDVGGYKGQWASDIYSMYKPEKIIIYEAMPRYAESIRNRFYKNRNIVVRDYGLGGENRDEKIYFSEDGSTVYNRGKSAKTINVRIADVDNAFKAEGIRGIDLLKINIEGCEYELIESLIQNLWIKKIKNIQVQFHDNVDNYKKRLENISRELALTHRRTYCYPMVWENWTIRTSE